MSVALLGVEGIGGFTDLVGVYGVPALRTILIQAQFLVFKVLGMLVHVLHVLVEPAAGSGSPLGWTILEPPQHLTERDVRGPTDALSHYDSLILEATNFRSFWDGFSDRSLPHA